MLDSEAEICYACGAIVPREEARRVRITGLLKICEQRLRWDRKDCDAWFTKAAALARMKDFRGAIAALNELTKLNHEYPGLWILKGKFYARLGDQDMARLCRRRALEQEGRNRTMPPAPSPAMRGAPPAGATFQCPVCGRQLPVEANECECGAEFEDDPQA
jgi:tetratricopeptide (TPR) repeat protein